MAATTPAPLRVVRHNAGGDHWTLVFGTPDHRLRRYVLHYCGYDEQTTTFRRRIELPGVRAPLIFNFGPAVSVRAARPHSHWQRHDDGFLAGLDDTYALVETSGRQSGVEVYLTPVGAALVTGVPMRHLRGIVASLGDLFGSSGGLVREQLLETPGWIERFALLDRFLLTRMSDATPPPPALTWALSRIHATRGALEIGSLTQTLGCSRRYLISLFNDHIGLPPKLLARILRFHHALELADRSEPGWAQIAHRCGYYDQAHMIADFQQFTGHSPTQYTARLLPDNGGVIGD